MSQRAVLVEKHCCTFSLCWTSKVVSCMIMTIGLRLLCSNNSIPHCSKMVSIILIYMTNNYSQIMPQN